MKYHYVYRITNTKLNKHYYGTRTSKNPKEDIGIKYFSSSKDKDFIKDQKENPQNYKYKIIKIFNNRKEAIKLEIKLHSKFDVGVNESFYNRAKQTSTGWDRTGCMNSTKAKEKQRRSMKKIFENSSERQKISKRNKEYYYIEENRLAQSERLKSYYNSNEHHTKGTVSVIDENGNTFRVDKDDSRYLSGELVGHNKGKNIHDKNSKQKISKTLKENGVNVGELNGNFGKFWATNGTESKMVYELPQGWYKGRIQKK